VKEIAEAAVCAHENEGERGVGGSCHMTLDHMSISRDVKHLRGRA
jgi:hypothetical protein